MIRKTSFCFLENEKVLKPYSTTLCTGITEKIIKKGSKYRTNLLSGTSAIVKHIKNIETRMNIQFDFM